MGTILTHAGNGLNESSSMGIEMRMTPSGIDLIGKDINETDPSHVLESSPM